jgi:hypothetical protein
MPFPVNTKNAMLGGQDFDAASLHTGFPGTTGTNEVTGGTPAYARKTISMSAASGGSRLLAAGVTFDVPACTVRWIGLWKAGVFVMPLVNGGATPRNFVAVASTDLIWAPAHGWTDGQKVVFFGIPPTGVTEGTVYFVVSSSTDNFKVAATLAGAAIDLTGPSSFGCVVSAMIETVFAIQDTHALTLVTETIAD